MRRELSKFEMFVFGGLVGAFILTIILVIIDPTMNHANGTPATHIQSIVDKIDYKVNFLFEIDGVKMYRFEDHGKDHYFGVQRHSINIDYEKQAGDER